MLNTQSELVARCFFSNGKVKYKNYKNYRNDSKRNIFSSYRRH